MDAMAEIKQVFFQECEEQLFELEAGLLTIERGDDDPETVNAVFRAVHSIKGGAGAFNLTDLVHFAHVFENTMDLVRVGKLVPTQPLIKLMLRAADILADLVRAARDDETSDPGPREAMAVELKAYTPGAAPAAVEAAKPVKAKVEEEFVFVPTKVDFADLDDLNLMPTLHFRILFQPSAELYAKGNETTILFRELSRLGSMSVTCDSSKLPALDAIEAEGAYFTWSVDLETSEDEEAVKAVFDFVEWDSALTIELIESAPAEEEPFVFQPTMVDADLLNSISDVPLEVPVEAAKPQLALVASKADKAAPSDDHAPADKKEAATATIRVDLERVDRLIDLVGELVINQAMLAERVAELGLARMSAVSIGLDELEQLTREIQDSVMAIRAQPVKSVFQRMPRLVREVALQTGKTVRLVTEGEGTEVDKTVIERLSDPLTHMIRNAIDHGLEKPEVRRAAGKPEEGLLKVAALHRSGRIVIEISDDGAGINRPRVRAIAVEKGLIAPEAKLSDEEIDNLIFLPGFSTAAVISDISGRGVGMDVVKRSIQALGGRISIVSRPGLGSTFTMSLPLTLAVLDGMVVSVAGQTLVIPLTAVVEILLPQATTVHNFGGNSRVMGVRNEFIPLIDVGQVLQYRSEDIDPKMGVALLVEAEGGVRNALLVDAIQGQRQVVIKSLEANYGHVPGIAAATILGDGRVALILDVDAVVVDSRAEFASSLPLAG
ncbi:chemotaxis protein CheA [Beijerinckia sp. L45]|uniref:chemotaxis protein CheA n=1 Tax=Beijerinckia sp. L45 TaxID=1641855 RepID=UPI00131CB215|nr:chemotaxis protein CheA [Beijerinckia sp. L45]